MLKTDLYIIQKDILGDTLTEAEKKRFDLQLENDFDFQKSYADYQRTRHIIRRAARQEMREKLQQFEKTDKWSIADDENEKLYFLPTLLRGDNRRIWLGAAASVVLLVCLSIWYLQKPPLSFNTIAENTQYRPYNYLNLATVRSKQTPPKADTETPIDADIAYLTGRYGAENTQKLATAMTDLKEKRYAQAVAILSELAFINDNDSMRLSRADAYLGANDVDKAITDYTAVVQNRIPQYKDLWMIADWHLALAYLKKGDRTESHRRIEIIAQTSGHSFQREAKEVIGMR